MTTVTLEQRLAESIGKWCKNRRAHGFSLSCDIRKYILQIHQGTAASLIQEGRLISTNDHQLQSEIHLMVRKSYQLIRLAHIKAIKKYSKRGIHPELVDQIFSKHAASVVAKMPTDGVNNALKKKHGPNVNLVDYMEFYEFYTKENFYKGLWDGDVE